MSFKGIGSILVAPSIFLTSWFAICISAMTSSLFNVPKGAFTTAMPLNLQNHEQNKPHLQSFRLLCSLPTHSVPPLPMCSVWVIRSLHSSLPFYYCNKILIKSNCVWGSLISSYRLQSIINGSQGISSSMGCTRQETMSKNWSRSHERILLTGSLSVACLAWFLIPPGPSVEGSTA